MSDARDTNVADIQQGAETGLLAIDIGSSRVKLGWFAPPGECTTEKQASLFPIAAPQLPQPDSTLAVSHANPSELWTRIGAWLQENCPHSPPGFVASVHPESLNFVQDMFAGRLRVITLTDLSLNVRVDQPESVGIDRLLSALAVNRIRKQNQPAVVVDLGTACTVDWIDTAGDFCGGAILPGPALAAAALHTGTASLPKLVAEQIGAAPPVVGKSTQAAISSGLYWGTVGAVRELVQKMTDQQEGVPQLLVTGGGAEQLGDHLADDHHSLRHLPNLVLSGIALAAEDLS